jgi:hypothetical protein
MTEEAKNKWDEETLLGFINYSFDPQTVCKEITRVLGLEKPLSFAHQNLNGLSNSNYILQNSDNKYFLRIQSKEAQDNWFTSFPREHEILVCFQENKLSIAPKVLYFDGSKTLIPKNFMILEFVHGTQNEEIDVTLVAKCLKKLHSIKIDEVVGGEKALTVDEKFLDSDVDLVPFFGKLLEGWILNTGKEILNESEYSRVVSLYNKCLELTRDLLPRRSGFGRKTIVHRDPHAMNFIYAVNELMLIDWEMAHLNHWSVDVVYFAKTISDEKEKIVMDAYGYPESKEEKLALWLQWMEQLVGAIGFFCNICRVLKNSGATLPNIGDYSTAKMKLDAFINKFETKISQYETLDQ